MNFFKRIAGIAMSVVMLASAVCFNVTTAAAAEVIPVYLNGKKLDFPANDAQPQIYQNRTYVPIRKTAEYLGLSIQWNAKTETLTFSREGLTIDHTMRSNIVYVSGKPVTFDTRSINVQNRTLMPIRMLGESIGATVDWDNAQRAVYITTAGAEATTEVTTTAPTAGKPELVNATANKTLVDAGDKVKISVTAKNAKKVKLTDGSTGKEIETISEYGESSDGTRLFEALINAENDKDDAVIKTVIIAAGDDTKFYDDPASTKTVNYGINGKSTKTTKNSDDDEDEDEDEDEEIKSDNLISYKLDNTSYSEDDYATLTIVTTDEVEKVRITNSFSSGRTEGSEFTEKSGKRTFKVKTRLSKTGTVYLYITLYIEGEGYESVNQKVTVKVNKSGSSSHGDTEITDVELINDTVYKGENAELLVYTSNDIQEVAIFDNDDKKVTSSYYYYGKEDDLLIWELSFKVDHSDKIKYTIYAYNEDDETDSETIKIEGESYSKNDPLVLSVEQRTTNIKEGDTCKFTVKCTSSIDSIVLTDHKGRELAQEEKGSKSGSFRNFTLRAEIDDLDEDYYIYGYDEDDRLESTFKFRIKGKSTETVEILGVDVDNSKVDYDEDIDVTIETTTNVTRLVIVDQEDNRVYKKTKPTSEKSDKYIWEASFQAEEKGKNTFTITVEDEDDNTDEWDFNVTVNK